MRELLRLPEPRWVVSPLTLTQVMVGRGSPWAAQVIATSWPVSATTSWGGWRNTGITVRHRGKKSYKQKKNTKKNKSVCRTSHCWEHRVAGLLLLLQGFFKKCQKMHSLYPYTRSSIIYIYFFTFYSRVSLFGAIILECIRLSVI